ncbi:hypothetical protein BJV78DRAFT_1158694 [Lactifluus subvellereus]|nr:hypothetical protein BJV78DRAFT_1158694 [Lactifluus subvellereus]
MVCIVHTGLKRRIIAWVQKGMVHDGWLIWKLNDVKQSHTVISGARGKGLHREKLVDLKLVWTLLVEKPFQHHGSSVRDPGCIHAQTQGGTDHQIPHCTFNSRGGRLPTTSKFHKPSGLPVETSYHGNDASAQASASGIFDTIPDTVGYHRTGIVRGGRGSHMRDKKPIASNSESESPRSETGGVSRPGNGCTEKLGTTGRNG